MTISSNDVVSQQQTLIFSYGTLKHGFSNHKLMQDLISKNDAVFIGNYITDQRLPLVSGPYGVPFLLNLPGSSRHRVHGELYSVSDSGLQRLDVLEGITLGHYERLPITIFPADFDSDDRRIDSGGFGRKTGVDFDSGECDRKIEAEAYYAHRSFAEDMWRRCGEVGFECYNKEVSKDYVRRDLRPKDLSFRQQISLFCSSN